MLLIKQINISFGFYLLPNIMYAEAPDKSSWEVAFVFVCWGVLFRHINGYQDDEPTD